MKKIYLTPLRTISLSFFLFIILASQTAFAADCGEPQFKPDWGTVSLFAASQPTSAMLSSQLVTKIKNKYGNNWCDPDKLCPSSVYGTGGGTCATAPDSLRGNWAQVDSSFTTYAGSYFGANNDGTGVYYTKNFCSICPTGSNAQGGGPSGSNAQGGGGGGAASNTPVTGNPTSVTVGGFDKLDNPLGDAHLTTISDVLGRALGIIIKIAIPFVVVMLIWTGFQFVIAQGNAASLTKARTTLLWVIVGAALLIGCVAIANAIANSVESIAKVTQTP